MERTAERARPRAARRAGLRRAALAPTVALAALLGAALAFAGPFARPSAPPRRTVAVRAEKEGGRTDEDRLAFMDSPVGQALGWLSKALAESPLNDAKIAFAKMQAGEYDEAEYTAKVDSYIKDNAAVMFSLSKCPFCIKAKQEFDDMGVKYLAVDIDLIPDGNAVKAVLADRTKRTSMPNIFIGGEGVGGCNDGPGIMTLKKEGKLAPMLQKAGALR
mmetsp:Transcript_59587/g.156665  ORF Transcript_59587/g.156665 Transcript_59587/m.156665 type:complete len:218 (-) Transcript_59587:79-732(-)